jgi:hypothetical protein
MSGDNNPYLPPKAAVADVVSDAPLIRPMAVTIALYLIGARVLMGAAVLVSSIIGASGSLLLMGLLAVGFSIAVAIKLGMSIARGRNWARIVYLVLTLFSLASIAFTLVNLSHLPAGVSMRRELSTWWLVTILLPTALSVTVVVLLFGPGREWFRARSE